MNWWPWHRRGRATDESTHAAKEAARAVIDAQAMHAKASEVADRLRETSRRNHFAEAVDESFRRRAQR